MSHKFNPGQAIMFGHVLTFAAHANEDEMVAQWLVVHDVSPVHAVNETFRDNRVLTAQVPEELIQIFVKLMSHDRRARFVNLLRQLAVPEGKPLPRNQQLVLK